MTEMLETPLPETDPEERAVVEAWLDDQLEGEDRAEVETWLRGDPLWRERLPALIRRHRRVRAVLDQEPAWERFGDRCRGRPSDGPVPAAKAPESARAMRQRQRLHQLFQRRASANRLVVEAEKLAAAGRHGPALERVEQAFELRDPRSLLGTGRLRELMRLAARCESARGNPGAAREWELRSEKLARG